MKLLLGIFVLVVGLFFIIADMVIIYSIFIGHVEPPAIIRKSSGFIFGGSSYTIEWQEFNSYSLFMKRIEIFISLVYGLIFSISGFLMVWSGLGLSKRFNVGIEEEQSFYLNDPLVITTIFIHFIIFIIALLMMWPHHPPKLFAH